MGGRGEVGDQVALLFRGEDGELAGRHHGEAGVFAFGDILLRHGVAARQAEHGDGGIGFLPHHPGEAAAIFQGKQVQLVVLADQGVGIDDVFQQVVEVGAVGTR